MITLRMNEYTDKEKTILREALESGLSMLNTEYCTHHCATCPAQHPCRDMQSTRDYLKAIEVKSPA